jgi:hypothetical protein
MELTVAVKGMMEARNQLRSKQGVTSPSFISEQMQRLTQYTGAVEEHLAELEEQLEVDEMEKFLHYTRTEGKSVNQSEILAKQEVGSLKGEIAKLKRYVNSSWSIIGVAQSRFNHLNMEYKQGKHAI